MQSKEAEYNHRCIIPTRQ